MDTTTQCMPGVCQWGGVAVFPSLSCLIVFSSLLPFCPSSTSSHRAPSFLSPYRGSPTLLRAGGILHSRRGSSIPPFSGTEPSRTPPPPPQLSRGGAGPLGTPASRPSSSSTTPDCPLPLPDGPPSPSRRPVGGGRWCLASLSLISPSPVPLPSGLSGVRLSRLGLRASGVFYRWRQGLRGSAVNG